MGHERGAGEDFKHVFDQKVTHDGIDSMKYLASAEPTYVGGDDGESDEIDGKLPTRTRFTGY